MTSRRKVNFMGQMVDAVDVDFETERENFSIYILHDGTTLKIKPVLTEVFRIEGAYQPNGDPVYGVNAQPVVAINAAESLRRRD